MSTYLTAGEVQGHWFLKTHMSSSEFLAWYYRVNECSRVKMPIDTIRGLAHSLINRVFG